jgi:hypothetical protein
MFFQLLQVVLFALLELCVIVLFTAQIALNHITNFAGYLFGVAFIAIATRLLWLSIREYKQARKY